MDSPMHELHKAVLKQCDLCSFARAGTNHPKIATNLNIVTSLSWSQHIARRSRSAPSRIEAPASAFTLHISVSQKLTISCGMLSSKLGHFRVDGRQHKLGKIVVISLLVSRCYTHLSVLVTTAASNSSILGKDNIDSFTGIASRPAGLSGSVSQ